MAGEEEPDPTSATQEALLRAGISERDYVKGEIRILEQRLNGMDRATELLSATVNRTPTIIQSEIAHLRERMDIQVDGIQRQFVEANSSRERQSLDSRAALDAAFAAQKEAAAKAERSTAETIGTNADLFRASVGGLEVQLNDLKERVVKLEATRQGGRETLTGVYAAIGALATVLTIVGIILFNAPN
jgi:hypothetical protein